MKNVLQSARDLYDRLRKNARQNLGAWKQVATTPKLRQEYGQLVVKPAVQRVTQPIKAQWQKEQPYMKAQVKAGVSLPPAPLLSRFLTQAPAGQRIRTAIEKPRIPLGKPFETFLTAKRPTIRWAQPGKLITSRLIERPEMAQVRAKLQRGEDLTKTEKRLAQSATLQQMAGFAGGIKKVGGLAPTFPARTAAPLPELPSPKLTKGIGQKVKRLTSRVGEVSGLPSQEKQSYKDIIAKTGLDVKKKVNLLDYFRTPDRVLKKIGLGKEATQLRTAHEGYLRDLNKEINRVSQWQQALPDEQSAQNVFRYLDGQKITLTPQEKAVATKIEKYLANWADKLNLPKDKRISHYITHIFDFKQAKEFDPDMAKIIAEKVPGSVYDPFLQKRLGKLGYVENVWKALDAYIKRATRKVNMDPALKQLSKSAKSLDLESYKYVKKFGDRINFRPTEIDSLIDNFVKSIAGYRFGARPTIYLTGKFRQTIYRGTLGLNLSSSLKNLTQGTSTYAKLGGKYTTLGYSDILSQMARGNLDELKQVGVLQDTFIRDRHLGVLKRTMDKIDKGLFSFFETAEKINRGSAYYGAKRKALNMGMSENKAIDYAKKIVRDTQFTFGKIDTPLVLSSDIAKTLLQFQSFGLKQAEMLGEMVSNKEWAGLVRWLGSSLLVIGTLGKLFGMELKDIIPSVRLGSPVIQLGKAGLQAISPEERTRAEGIQQLKRAPSMFLPAGTQLKKTIEGLRVAKEGVSTTPTGRIRFTVKKDLPTTLKAAAFGQWSLPEARAYVKTLGKSKSEIEYKRLSKLPPAEARAEAVKIKQSNPSLFAQIKKQAKDEQLEITKKEKQVRTLPVNDGSRVRMVVKELAKKKTNAEKRALIIDWKAKGIVTDSIMEQLKTMAAKGLLK